MNWYGTGFGRLTISCSLPTIYILSIGVTWWHQWEWAQCGVYCHLALTGRPDALVVIEGGVIRDYTVKGSTSDESRTKCSVFAMSNARCPDVPVVISDYIDTTIKRSIKAYTSDICSHRNKQCGIIIYLIENQCLKDLTFYK